MRTMALIRKISGLLVFVIPLANAIECSLGKDNTYSIFDSRDRMLAVSNQSDIDINIGNCSDVPGSILIKADYSGKFNISGIRNVSFTILNTGPTPGITELIMDDLEYVGALELKNMTQITSLSLPKLNRARYIEFEAAGPVPAKVSLPALDNAISITVNGNISSLELPLIRNSTIEVHTTERYRTFAHRYLVPLDISLPLLEYTRQLTVFGNITGVFTPRLKKMGDKEYSGYFPASTSEIAPYFPLAISLPALEYADGLDLSEPKNVSLPLLANVSSLTITTFSSRESFMVDLPSLVIAKRVVVFGVITELRIPKLKYVDRMFGVSSDLQEFDCDPVEEVLNRTISVTGNVAELSCREATRKPTGLSNATKQGLGYGLGLGGGVVLLIALTVFFVQRHAKKNAGKPTQAHDEPALELPAYTSSPSPNETILNSSAVK